MNVKKMRKKAKFHIERSIENKEKLIENEKQLELYFTSMTVLIEFLQEIELLSFEDGKRYLKNLKWNKEEFESDQ